MWVSFYLTLHPDLKKEHMEHKLGNQVVLARNSASTHCHREMIRAVICGALVQKQKIEIVKPNGSLHPITTPPAAIYLDLWGGQWFKSEILVYIETELGEVITNNYGLKVDDELVVRPGYNEMAFQPSIHHALSTASASHDQVDYTQMTLSGADGVERVYHINPGRILETDINGMVLLARAEGQTFPTKTYVDYDRIQTIVVLPKGGAGVRFLFQREHYAPPPFLMSHNEPLITDSAVSYIEKLVKTIMPKPGFNAVSLGEPSHQSVVTDAVIATALTRLWGFQAKPYIRVKLKEIISSYPLDHLANEDGTIIFNVSMGATQDLHMSVSSGTPVSSVLNFTARFSQRATTIQVPFTAILQVYDHNEVDKLALPESASPYVGIERHPDVTVLKSFLHTDDQATLVAYLGGEGDETPHEAPPLPATPAPAAQLRDSIAASGGNVVSMADFRKK